MTNIETEPSRTVYRERAHLVAHLAAIYPATMGADPEAPAWPVVTIWLPTGPACWHIALADLNLFSHVPPGRNGWDGHTTDEKYERLDQWTKFLKPDRKNQ